MSLSDSQKEMLAEVGEILLVQAAAYAKSWARAKQLAKMMGATEEEMEQAFNQQARIVTRKDGE